MLRRAQVSHPTLAALRRGGRVRVQSLLSLAWAAKEPRQEGRTQQSEQDQWRQVAINLAALFQAGAVEGFQIMVPVGVRLDRHLARDPGKRDIGLHAA